ncbi:hypothetical protein ACJMK2_037654 [Sinanodonta woodiana]|uniref:Uncharacterized protein n=1 Tax=Sinanodonta woodiana TaxID=1069815 RepID=A0ABD3WL51_SINWO
MGCNSSKINPVTGELMPIDKKETTVNGTAHKNQNGTDKDKNDKNKKLSKDDSGAKPTTDSNANSQNFPPIKTVPKSVAFEVVLDDQPNGLLITKKPPKRLQALEPLNLPKLTAEELAEKQRLADEKREKERARKVSASKKSSKRRKELLAAREFELKQQLTETEQKIMDAQESADKTREAKLAEIKERQRLRAERAKRAREKAKKMQEEDQTELGIMDNVDAVEKDEEFNNDDVDSWLDGSNNDDVNSDSGERIYSGRASPKKRLHRETNTNSSNIHRGASASTVDSFENAFNKKPPSASAPRTVKSVKEQDDFFDS